MLRGIWTFSAIMSMYGLIIISKTNKLLIKNRPKWSCVGGEAHLNFGNFVSILPPQKFYVQQNETLFLTRTSL